MKETKKDTKNTDIENAIEKLETLFPGEDFEISPENKVKVKPISLKYMPKVVKAFGSLLSIAEKDGFKGTDLILAGMDHLMELLPYCIDHEEMDEISAEHLPDILAIIIKQNFNPSVLKKWQALFRQFKGIFPDVAGQLRR